MTPDEYHKLFFGEMIDVHLLHIWGDDRRPFIVMFGQRRWMSIYCRFGEMIDVHLLHIWGDDGRPFIVMYGQRRKMLNDW